MSQYEPPKGFRDLLPEEFAAREYLKRIIAGTYESFGYQPIDTPVMERVDVLLGKGGGENEKLMFKVLKRGKKLEDAMKKGNEEDLSDMGLRFDLTVPLARFYASNKNSIPPVFKRYQIAPVWRADRPQFGRFREFVQCDVDVIGSASMAAEADVICATSACLTKLGFSGMELRLNNRPLVPVLVSKLGAPADMIEEGLRILDKIDRLGIDGAAEEMGKMGIPQDACEKVRVFYSETMALENEQKINAIADVCAGEGEKYISQLKEFIAICPGIENMKIIIDPFLVRGMDYYTGPIFEVRLPGVGFSVAGGGRYDRLVGMFSGDREVPATGFSIGFERILVMLKEKGLLPEGVCSVDVVVCADSGELAKEVISLAGAIRGLGLKVDATVGQTSTGKVLQEAEKRKTKYGVIIRAAEPGMVEVRDLKTRKGIRLNTNSAPDWIKGKITDNNG